MHENDWVWWIALTVANLFFASTAVLAWRWCRASAVIVLHAVEWARRHRNDCRGYYAGCQVARIAAERAADASADHAGVAPDVIAFAAPVAPEPEATSDILPFIRAAEEPFPTPVFGPPGMGQPIA